MSKEPISSKSETDWQKLNTMVDEEIDLSNCPEITPEKFVKAVVRHGLLLDKKKTELNPQSAI